MDLSNFHIVDLSSHFNNDGISRDGNRKNGNFDSWGKTFPYEELPSSLSLFESNSIYFLFPEKKDGLPNNMTLMNQLILVEENNYSTLHLLATSENGSFIERINFQYQNFYQEIECLIDDFFLFGNLEMKNLVGIQCSHYHIVDNDCSIYSELQPWKVFPTIWHIKVPLRKDQVLINFSFLTNPCVHVFSMTLEK